MEERVVATYWIETPCSLERAAEMMAGEQSTGTFIAVPGETPELKERHGARIECIEPLESVDQPSLPYAMPPGSSGGPRYHRARVTLSFPLANFGISLPNLLATVAGNLYELREFSGIRLVNVELPSSFSEKYPGPQFGILGTRQLTGVYERPIIGTIIKPSIGLKPEEYGPLVQQLAEAGLDFIKDDELCANPPVAPLAERVRIVMDTIERAADKTGKKTMYAFNITGDIEEMKRNHEIVVQAGGTCVMVSINSVGWAGVSYLRSFSQLPIHGHRNQWGAMTRCPALGMSFTVYQKLCRLAGVDHLHTNGLDSKFAESNESVAESIRNCLTPFLGGYEVMPVLSSAQWAGNAEASYRAAGSVDVIQVAGGGILAHPGGIAAGVKSMQLGWEAAVRGQPLQEYAQLHPELAEAIRTFGAKG